MVMGRKGCPDRWVFKLQVWSSRDAPPRRPRPSPPPPKPPSSSPSPLQASPSFPPGFPSPNFEKRELALVLFPQLRGVSDPDSSPPRSARSGSSFVSDSVEDAQMGTSASDGQGKKVSFAPTLQAVAQGQSSIHVALRPCLKSASKSSAFNAAAGDRTGKGAAPCPALDSPASKSLAFMADKRSARHPCEQSSSDASDDSWQPVRAPYWWRSQQFRQEHSSRRPRGANHRHSSPRARPAPPNPQALRKPYVKPSKRECYRCLARGQHPAYQCRDPVRCSNCRGWRHRARDCTRSLSSSTSTGSSYSPRSSPAPAPLHRQPLVAPAMPRVGDPSLRPTEGHVIINSTPAMEAQAAKLTNNGAFIWLGGRRPSVCAADIKAALADQARVDPDLIKVVPHYPQDFFALFEHKHHRDFITAQPGRFLHGDLDIHAANWSELAQAEQVGMYQHVHLCIEGMSLQAWTDDVAARVLGPNTTVHYFDVATLQKEDVTVFSLWAWSEDPNAIPKVQKVTLAATPGSIEEIGRRGLRRKVLVHLDIHEDCTPSADGQVPRRPHYSHRFDWKLGTMDGERNVADRNKTPARRSDDHDHHRRGNDRGNDRRQDDEDEDRRGRKDDRSWAQRIFRSRSRPVDRRGDDRAGGRRDDRDDRDRRSYRDERRGGHDSRGDGRHRVASAMATYRTPDLTRVQVLRGGAVIPVSGSRRRRSASPESSRRPREAVHADFGEGRGRSPPSSPRTSAKFHMEAVHIPRAAARGVAWFGLPCFGSKVTTTADDEVILPPPPPLPTDGSRPERLFSPTILRRPTLDADHGMESMVLRTPSPQPGLGESPMDESSPEVITPIFVPAPTPPARADDEGDEDFATPARGRNGRAGDATDALTPLFVPVIPPLLQAPGSTPPRPPKARRKTLAGVSGFAGFPVRSSPRLKEKKRTMPIAQLAEKVLCHRLGIFSEGEPVTEAAIAKFVQMFKGTLPDIAIAALRALFRMDCDFATAVEDALVAHGGDGAVDQTGDLATTAV